MTQPDPQSQPDGQEPQATPPPQDAPPHEPPAQLDGKVDDLPSWAREAIAKANREAAQYRTKVREYETAQMSEAEKAAARLADAEKTAAEAASEAIRYRMAMRHGLSEEDLDLLGTGTEEQIEARAKRLADRSGARPPSTRKPSERLRPGAAEPEREPEETDIRKLGAAIYGGR